MTEGNATPTCEIVGCTNAARYDGRRCGIHDIMYNLGRGKRAIDIDEQRANLERRALNMCAVDDDSQQGTKDPVSLAHHNWFYGRSSSTLQAELAKWQEQNFGMVTSVKRPDLLLMFCGMAEELGELAHALLKHEQEIRGMYDEAFLREAADALADGRVFATQLATGLGICEQTNFEETARQVIKRDWKRFPKDGLTG